MGLNVGTRDRLARDMSHICDGTFTGNLFRLLEHPSGGWFHLPASLEQIPSLVSLAVITL